ncbi:Glutamine synthetase, catalytic domain [Fusobacterium necrophorum subsp. necrophorum]|nr:Glutamine synthetase, catalytic domain [Fusobacterium necrophorum subsp. necrophorum]
MNDHYYGTIKERVEAFMTELDRELWKVGVMSKTKHNEVAPNQFEVAIMFNTANVAVDQNQITMDMIKKVATRIIWPPFFMKNPSMELTVPESTATGLFLPIPEKISWILAA